MFVIVVFPLERQVMNTWYILTVFDILLHVEKSNLELTFVIFKKWSGDILFIHKRWNDGFSKHSVGKIGECDQ